MRDALHRLFRDERSGLSPGDLSVVEDPDHSSIPTYTRIRIEDVTVDFYLAVRAGDPSLEFMPPGLQAHVVCEDGRGVRIQSCWERLSDGRDFFRNQLADNVQHAVVEGNQRGDFVREELPLTSLELGDLAGEFDQERFHEIPQATVSIVHIAGVGAAEQQPVPWTAIVDKLEKEPDFGGSLVLRMVGTDAGGIEITEVWTDPEAASRFHDHSLPAVLERSLGPNLCPELRVETYPVSYCMIATPTLAEFGFVLEDTPSAAARAKRYVRRRRRPRRQAASRHR